MNDPETSDPSRTRRESNRARTLDTLASAALDLFETQGYSETTVEQIAQRAESSSATFFRYYGSKEEVLFASQFEAERELMRYISDRSDSAQTLTALAEPFSTFAKTFLADSTSRTQRSTRLVMTTRELEAPSMRMRLRWEHAVVRQLRTERKPQDPLDTTLLANLAVSCLAAALWVWQQPDNTIDVQTLTRRAFERAAILTP